MPLILVYIPEKRNSEPVWLWNSDYREHFLKYIASTQSFYNIMVKLLIIYLNALKKVIKTMMLFRKL